MAGNVVSRPVAGISEALQERQEGLVGEQADQAGESAHWASGQSGLAIAVTTAGS
jgi:hypothetical protein